LIPYDFLLRIISLRRWTCLFPKSELAFPKWYTSNICHQINCLRTIRKKYRSNPNIHNINHIHTAEENLQKDIYTAKANFEANLVQNFAFRNDSKIFQHVKNITKSASICSMMYFNEKSTTKDSEKATLSCTFTLFSLKVPMHFHKFQDMLSISQKIKYTMLYCLSRQLVLMVQS